MHCCPPEARCIIPYLPPLIFFDALLGSVPSPLFQRSFQLLDPAVNHSLDASVGTSTAILFESHNLGPNSRYYAKGKHGVKCRYCAQKWKS